MSKFSLKTMLVYYHLMHKENVEDEIEQAGGWVKKNLKNLTQWKQLADEGVTAEYLHSHDISLCEFSHLKPKYRDVEKLVLALGVRLKHLEGKRFFDPARIGALLSDPKKPQIYSLDSALRKNYNKTAATKINSTKKVEYCDEFGRAAVASEKVVFFKYSDFEKIGWTYDDMLSMGVDYRFLRLAGLRDAAHYHVFTKSHALDDSRWTRLGLTKDEKDFLL